MKHDKRWGAVDHNGFSELTFPMLHLRASGADLELFLKGGEREEFFLSCMARGGFFVLDEAGRTRVIPTDTITSLYFSADNRPLRYTEVAVRFVAKVSQ